MAKIENGQITVEPGDTLTKIAAELGISVSEILAANSQITNPDVILVGQVFTIPGGEEALADEPETLEAIAAAVAQAFNDRGLNIQTATESTGERIERIAREIFEGTRTFSDFEATLDTFATVQQPVVDDSALVDESGPADPAGQTESVPGILDGGTIVKVARAEQNDLWFVSYEWPPGSGNFNLYQFNDIDQLIASIGEDFSISGDFTLEARGEDFLQDANVNILGSATEVVGLKGNFNQLIDDVMFETALNAGIRDPGIIGTFLSDPDIQLIMAQGAIGEFPPERIQAEVRNTDFYQNTLYPGINSFLAAGVDNPEAQWKQYAANVENALDILGVARDQDGSFRQTVGTLLAGGVSDEEFNTFAPTFIRASTSPEFASVLNQWTQRDLGTSIDFDDVFDVLNGTATTELQQVVESANIQFQAEQQAIFVDREQISALARTTELSEQQIALNFSKVEQNFMAIGNENLRRFGLTQADLISSAFGLQSASGLAAGEVQRRARKGSIELGAADDPKTNLFVGFDEQGRPVRPGLASLRVEGA